MKKKKVGENLNQKERPRKRWSQLSVRVTLSYVGLSVLNVLLLEFFLGGFILLIVVFSPVVDVGLQPVTLQVAQSYASAAQLRATGGSLNPSTTFQPDQPFSLAPPSQ